jgi:hypothetical protein
MNLKLVGKVTAKLFFARYHMSLITLIFLAGKAKRRRSAQCSSSCWAEQKDSYQHKSDPFDLSEHADSQLSAFEVDEPT